MYIKDRHFSLSDKTWNINEAKVAIQEIATDAIQHLKSGYLWPSHPLDDDASSHSFYYGTSGVSWALDYLCREDVADIEFNLKFALKNQLEKCQAELVNMPHTENASYLFGDIPILMMQFQLSKDQKLLDELASKITVNNSQPTRELMWGSAGTMIALTHLQRWLPNDIRWEQAYQVQSTKLMNELQENNEFGFMWKIDVYGKQQYFLGPMHGNSGNVLSLIKGRHLLKNSDYKEFCEKVMISTVRTAVTDHKYANWPPIAGKTDRMLLQYCHGAPGMLTALSELPADINSEFDEVLLKGGELIWDAGPLRKGFGLCHGTAGNGFAFLKLFQRTNNQIWLDRARAFAMKAIEQHRQAKILFQQGRYALWNGDVGLAIFLNECIKETANFPTIDNF
ncbi:lanthionine synthetase C family protein [Microbulbifer sp. ZKSA006]|uniref:lanthionine synthetase C family protein n=1 Tax=Microbulbifer sp. ZKSA006 TaxID=3243390 RepID=UPI00403A1474